MAMKDRWVQAEVNDMLERRLSPNPLVTIHKYPGADHAFARHGGKTYSKPEADRALALSVDYFRKHLGARQKGIRAVNESSARDVEAAANGRPVPRQCDQRLRTGTGRLSDELNTGRH